jgi:hypothetical protein
LIAIGTVFIGERFSDKIDDFRSIFNRRTTVKYPSGQVNFTACGAVICPAVFSVTVKVKCIFRRIQTAIIQIGRNTFSRVREIADPTDIRLDF